jgi:hypothetical protein
MKFVGRLVKESAKVEYFLNVRKKNTFDLQVKELSKLLKKAKRTELGVFYGFSSILKKDSFIQNFQKTVPLFTYDSFYEQWLHKLFLGQKKVIWSSKISNFALSSGTTGSPSKKIPVSKQMLRSFQKTSIRQIATLWQLDLPTEFFQKQVLIVGGSTKLKEEGDLFFGDLSGILKKHTKKIASPFAKPSKAITDIKDWNIKLEKMVLEAPNWDIGIIAGIPSWCVLLLESIVRHYKLNTIHDLWPNLKVYIHGGIYMEPYQDRLNALCVKPLFQFDTYLASEGYFAYQMDTKNPSMRLLLDNGIFYEFIPFTSEYFDNQGQVIDKYKAYTLDEVQEGVDYALVISTNAGLWRYLLGDTICFTNLSKREIKITGRTKQYLSLTGEHLSLDNIREAIKRTSTKLHVVVEEYTVYANKEKYCHEWFISTDKEVDPSLFTETLEIFLKQ